MNKAIQIGNVGKDPETFTTKSGKKVAKFSLATTDGGETQWHNIVAWEKTAEIVEQYVKKGMLVAVDGQIKYRSYDDKDGNKRQITEIVASSVELLSKSDKPEAHHETDDRGSGSDGLQF